MRKIIFILLILQFSVIPLKAQTTDSKNFISFSGGKIGFGGKDHLFYSKGLANSGAGIRLSYNSVLTSIKGEVTQESVNIYSLNIGFFMVFP